MLLFKNRHRNITCDLINFTDLQPACLNAVAKLEGHNNKLTCGMCLFWFQKESALPFSDQDMPPHP